MSFGLRPTANERCACASHSTCACTHSYCPSVRPSSDACARCARGGRRCRPLVCKSTIITSHRLPTALDTQLPVLLTEFVGVRLTSALRPPIISHVDASRPTQARSSGLFAFYGQKKTLATPKQYPQELRPMYLPIKKVAEHFSRHPDTIRLWVKNGKFPPPVLMPSGRPAWPDSVLLGHDVGADVADTSG
jgi:hypothetical protein